MTSSFRISLSLALLALSSAAANLGQAQTEGGSNVRVKKDLDPLVKNVYVMPYLTVSGNFHSGKAFPKSASGIGYGGGIAFDLTEDGQKSGIYFDFAWQDMRAFAKEGSCMNQTVDDTLLRPVDAEHYFQYALLEAFLKLQGEKRNGYFLLGASFGYATTSFTRRVGTSRESFSYWEGSSYGHEFRLDIRGGLGVILANLGRQKLIFEARVGYPITAAISDYANICLGNGELGNWRLITLQGNLGVRF